jgi:two-component system, NtrC family, nitrogen regulation sensor histidine kinase NtrY
MKSLRSRLIVGFSLLAVIPLGVALLLASRVRAMVEAQAAERLSDSLGMIEARMAADFYGDPFRLADVGLDPELSRLYLNRSPWSSELKYFLERRRALTGLDFLDAADTSGTVVASSDPSPTHDHPHGRSIPAFAPGRTKGPFVERVAGGTDLAFVSMGLLMRDSRVIGFVLGGRIFDLGYVSRVAKESGIELVLRDGEGALLAGTIPAPAREMIAIRPKPERVRIEGKTFLSRSIDIPFPVPPHATITGFASTAAADRTIASLYQVSALLALLGLGIAIVLAVFWSRQVSRPVERLAAFSERLAQGEWDEPLALESVREIQTLVAALERMRGDLKTYRERLVTSERQAAWSQMARKVAHEVKNPLTPIAISVADLKRSYDQKRPDFPDILDRAVRTVEEEVETLRRLLQEFSDFGRFPAPRLEPCRVADLLTDLEALYGREIAEGRLRVVRPVEETTFLADRGQLRQALVNLVKNGLEALQTDGKVELSARRDDATVEISIADTGPGLSAPQKQNLFAPGFTTKPGGSGLGLTIVERIVSDHRGTIAMEDAAPHGTIFRVRLPLDPKAPS